MTLDYEIYKEGGLLNGRYQKIEDISEGSYGYVSLAKDTKLKKLVAVKYIFKLEEEEEEQEEQENGAGHREDSNNRDRDITMESRKEKKSLVSEAVKSRFADNICVEAMYEVDIQTKLGKHRNIVELLDYFDSYIIMEYCSGGDLYEAIKDDVIPRRTKSITYILNQIADAVEFAHSKHIYHRDIKPENILITGIDWTVKLTDWGLATTSQTSMDRNVGSERYMAPELFESNLDIEERKEPYECDKVDLWAMGIVFLNIVFHKNPFKVANQTDKSFCYFAANREALFDVFSTMAYDFFQVLRYCLTIDPSNRSLSKMRRELDNLMEYTLDDEYYNSVEDEYDIVFSTSPEIVPPSSAPVSLPTPPTSMTSIGKPDNMRIDSKPSDVSPKVNSPLAPPSPATVAAPITTQATTTGTTINTSESANTNTVSSTAASGAVDRTAATVVDGTTKVDDKNIDFEQRPIFDTAKRNTSSHYHHYRYSPTSPPLLSVSPGSRYRSNNQNNNPRSGTSSAQHSPPDNTHYGGVFKKHYYDIPKLQVTPDYGPHANNNSGLSYSYGAHVATPHYNDHNPRYSGYISPNGSYHNYSNNAGAHTGGNRYSSSHYYYGSNNHYQNYNYNYAYSGNNKPGNYSSKYYHHRDGNRNGRRSSERSTSVPKFKYGRQPRRRNERLQSGSNNESERGSGHYPRTAGIKINGKNRTKIYTNARKPLGIPTPNTHITTFSKDYHNKVKNEKFNTRDFFTPPSMQNKYLEGVFETDLARHRVYFNNRPRDNSRSNNSTLRGWNGGNSQYKNRRPSAGAVLYYANSGGNNNNNNNNNNSNLSLTGRGKNAYRRSSYCTSNPVIPPNNTGGSSNSNSGAFVPPRMRTGGYHNNGSNLFSVSPYIPDISTVLDEPSKHVPVDLYGQNDAYTNEVNDLNDEDHESDGGLFSMETNDHAFIQGMQNLSIQDGGKQQQQEQQPEQLGKPGSAIAHLAGFQISGNNFAMPISGGPQDTGTTGTGAGTAATGTATTTSTAGTATATTSTTTAAGTLDTSKLPDLLRSPIVEEAQLSSMAPSQEISSFMSAMNALSRPNNNLGFGNISSSSQRQGVGAQPIASSGNQLKSGVYVLPHNRKQYSGFANEATLSVSNNMININKNQQQTTASSISPGGIGTSIHVSKKDRDRSGSGSSGDGMFQFSDNENVNNDNNNNDNDNETGNDNDNLIFSAEGISGAV